MLWVKLQVFCLVFCCIKETTDSQDIVGCGGFIKSEVEINFSVIEACTCCLDFAVCSVVMGPYQFFFKSIRYKSVRVVT